MRNVSFTLFLRFSEINVPFPWQRSFPYILKICLANLLTKTNMFAKSREHRPRTDKVSKFLTNAHKICDIWFALDRPTASSPAAAGPAAGRAGSGLRRRGSPPTGSPARRGTFTAEQPNYLLGGGIFNVVTYSRINPPYLCTLSVQHTDLYQWFNST